MKSSTIDKRVELLNLPAPDCCDKDKWIDWLSVAVLSEEAKVGRNKYDIFCSDCTPQYSNKMKAKGKCHAKDYIAFRIYTNVYYGMKRTRKVLLNKNRDFVRYCSEPELNSCR